MTVFFFLNLPESLGNCFNATSRLLCTRSCYSVLLFVCMLELEGKCPKICTCSFSMLQVHKELGLSPVALFFSFLSAMRKAEPWHGPGLPACRCTVVSAAAGQHAGARSAEHGLTRHSRRATRNTSSAGLHTENRSFKCSVLFGCMQD